MDREEIRKLTEKELEELTPELPEGFEDWCSRQMVIPPVYYKRAGEYTDCICGICGGEYRIHTPKYPEYGTYYHEIPVRYGPAECQKCKKKTVYEWKRITGTYHSGKRFYLYQLCRDNSVVVRIFTYVRRYRQGSRMEDCLYEKGRFFLLVGQVKKLIWGWKGWILKETRGYPDIDVAE